MTSTHPGPATASAESRGFVAATVSFVSVFAAGAAAIPLYDTYRSADGLTNDEFSLVAVAYFVCAVFALLVLGRLSNHHGRRPVSIAALLLAVAGCLTLLLVHSFLPLLIGRALQGLAAGLASSAIGAYAVDTAPRRPGGLPRPSLLLPPPSDSPSASSSPESSSNSRLPRASLPSAYSPWSCSAARPHSRARPKPCAAPPAPGPH
jgi:hypothetical protein